MSSTKSMLAQALKLPANDRAALVEKLILSLNETDASLDADGLKEAGIGLQHTARVTLRL